MKHAYPKHAVLLWQSIYSPSSPVWSKVSPVSILLYFTHSRAPGLLTVHVNINVTVFVAWPPNA